MKELVLSKRMEAVAALVPQNMNVVADVGCDHAYVSIKLKTDNKADKVIAMDLREGPLEIAAKNIERFGVEKDIEIRLSDGLDKLSKAEADAILAKAEAMKQYGEAATLQLILDSKVLPEMVKAYSEPMAAAMSQIDSITMYGEGNTAKLNEEITRNGTQIFAGLEKATGLDIKSLLAGYLGGKLINKADAPKAIKEPKAKKEAE